MGVAPASRRAGRDDEHADAVVDPGRDGDLVGRVTVEHVVLGALEPPAAVGAAGHHAEVGGGRAPGGARAASAPVHLAARDGAEEARLLLGRARVAHDAVRTAWRWRGTGRGR